MISVIVPVFNTADYLEKCIDSILNQTYRDIEIVLVDDGSTDGSEHICDEYAKKDCRIKAVHKENGGLVSARKKGLSIATGEYIGFVDSDDWIEPDMYEKLYEKLCLSDVDVVMCGRIEERTYESKVVCHGIPEGRYVGEELKEIVFPKMIVNEAFFRWGIFPSYWDKLFKRDAIEQYINSVDDSIVMGEDAAGVYPCLLHCRGIYILQECLYHYRQVENSMVRKQNPDIKAERQRFRTLYQTTRNKFLKGKNIYDFQEQWMKYVLFLMIPRADILYEGIYKSNYLFPFPDINKNDNIIIYCAGLWGQRLAKGIMNSNSCNVLAVADLNYKHISIPGIDVISPEGIGKYDCEKIVVASSYADARESIIRTLETMYPLKRIYGLDESIVFDKRTIKAFGLE